jgi:hypothetical protein
VSKIVERIKKLHPNTYIRVILGNGIGFQDYTKNVLEYIEQGLLPRCISTFRTACEYCNTLTYYGERAVFEPIGVRGVTLCQTHSRARFKKFWTEHLDKDKPLWYYIDD